MTADVLRRREPREPLHPSAFLAMALELGMLATFLAHRSVGGVVLWFFYVWFSATWHVVEALLP